MLCSFFYLYCPEHERGQFLGSIRNVGEIGAGAIKLRTVFLLNARRCGDYAGEVIGSENHMHNQLIIS
jgi:hypothetical protein